MKKILKSIHRAARGYLKNSWEPVPSILNEHERVVGLSHEGREIQAYRVNKGPIRVLFVGTIHGNEVGTKRLLSHLYNHLLDHADSYKEFSFWFIPCLNPDGFAHASKHPDYFKGGRKGRFNARAVDLNRNFPVASFKRESNWNHGANYKEKTPVFCGDYGGSEPEILALTSFILKEKIPVFFIFHNVGEDVMPSDDTLAQQLAKTFSEHSGFKYVDRKEWEGLGQTGTCREWCEENGVSFVEVEASAKSTRYGSDWKQQKTALLACLEQLRKSA